MTAANFEPAGELKFGQVGIANLRVKTLDVERLTAEMRDRVQRAPKLFDRAALVIDFGGLPGLPDEATARALIDALREAGADPNAADRTGNTALHRAAMVNAGAHVLALLEAGADPQAKNAQDASFQSYYFRVPDNVINEESRGHRKAVVEWLRGHDVPLEAGVSP